MKRTTAFAVSFVGTMIFSLHAQAGEKLYWDANGADADDVSFGTTSLPVASGLVGNPGMVMMVR